MPTPSCFRTLFVRYKRANIFACSLSGMPEPVSDISILANISSERAKLETVKRIELFNEGKDVSLAVLLFQLSI